VRPRGWRAQSSLRSTIKRRHSWNPMRRKWRPPPAARKSARRMRRRPRQPRQRPLERSDSDNRRADSQVPHQTTGHGRRRHAHSDGRRRDKAMQPGLERGRHWQQTAPPPAPGVPSRVASIAPGGPSSGAADAPAVDERQREEQPQRSARTVAAARALRRPAGTLTASRWLRPERGHR
jgi:hypothetical protein